MRWGGPLTFNRLKPVWLSDSWKFLLRLTFFLNVHWLQEFRQNYKNKTQAVKTGITIVYNRIVSTLLYITNAAVSLKCQMYDKFPYTYCFLKTGFKNRWSTGLIKLLSPCAICFGGLSNTHTHNIKTYSTFDNSRTHTHTVWPATFLSPPTFIILISKTFSQIYPTHLFLITELNWFFFDPVISLELI